MVLAHPRPPAGLRASRPHPRPGSVTTKGHPMSRKPRFRLWRPGRRSERRQVAALRAKTAQARAQLATTDAMLADRTDPRD